MVPKSEMAPSADESSKAAEQPTQESPSAPTLQTLPPEIRNQIFTLALVDEESIAATSTICQDLTTLAHPQPPPLARVCRQMRKEAIPIFYGGNTFAFQRLRGCSHRKVPPVVTPWFAGLAKYDEEVSKSIQNFAFSLTEEEGALGISVKREQSGSIVITAGLNRMLLDGRPPACLCNFKTKARRLLSGPFSGERSLQNVTDLFYAILAYDGMFILRGFAKGKRGKSCSCVKEERSVASIRVFADGSVQDL